MIDMKQVQPRNQEEIADFLARAALHALPSYMAADLSGSIFERPAHDFEMCHELAIRLGIRDQMRERFRALRKAARSH